MPDEVIMPPVHPGEILLTEFLEPLELSQYQLARSIAVPPEVTADDVGNVSCPVLVLAGGDDPVSPVTSTRRVTALAQHPALGLHVFAGVGHGVFRQAPAQAFALLRAFL
jgi:pimeloyl-ACP methyl ester carboxylesterase